MAKTYYKKSDFRVKLSESEIKKLGEQRILFSAQGEQAEYDVFLSHSTKDITLIRNIKDRLELEFNISVYIDWEEDAGTSRYEIADKVKKAMKRSKSFIVVKTDNSDDSSWVPWETGFFDNINTDKIGVLLVEDEDNEFSYKTFEHREYLKNYIMLGIEDIVDFIKKGSSYIKFKNKNIDLSTAPFTVKKPEIMVKPHRYE